MVLLGKLHDPQNRVGFSLREQDDTFMPMDRECGMKGHIQQGPMVILSDASRSRWHEWVQCTMVGMGGGCHLSEGSSPCPVPTQASLWTVAQAAFSRELRNPELWVKPQVSFRCHLLERLVIINYKAKSFQEPNKSYSQGRFSPWIIS
jgi:hypothetical protein